MRASPREERSHQETPRAPTARFGPDHDLMEADHPALDHAEAEGDGAVIVQGRERGIHLNRPDDAPKRKGDGVGITIDRGDARDPSL